MKISMYELSIVGYMWRFFFMMAIVIGTVFSGVMYLAPIASFSIFKYDVRYENRI